MPPWVHLDLGQIITSLLLAGIGYGLKQVYNLFSGFVEKVHENEATLDMTAEMVDRHSVSLMRAKLLEPPVKRMHLGRRVSDRDIFVIDDEIHS